MNPFEKPPRPAKNKALSRQINNPFDTHADENDITIEFQSPPSSSSTNNIAPPSRFSPIAINPQNKHRPYAATVQYAQPPPKLPRPQQQQAPPPPHQAPRRVFGGNIPISGDNSPHAVQYRAEILSQRASPHDSQNDDTESEPSPSVRSPFRLLMPSRSSYQPANRASPGLTRDDYADESSSSSEESDEDISDSEGTDTTAGPSTRSSGSAGQLNDTGIEMQTVTPPKAAKKSKKNAPEPKQKKEKKKKAKKPRKGPVVCVDEDNENQLIRFLISEKGKLVCFVCIAREAQFSFVGCAYCVFFIF